MDSTVERVTTSGVTAEGVDGTTPAPKESTRDRILDVALDLFTKNGYDGTSLREIAERLEVTKAAIYYHFASKEDILMALHMRLHEFGREALGRIRSKTVTKQVWRELLNELISQMLSQRKIFLMHERNQAALEKLHDTQHEAEHEDLHDQLRAVLADARLPLRDRVRMACSLGAIFAALFLTGDGFNNTPDGTLGDLLRGTVRDILDD
jgi:AcrR family transcriptional regulator